MKSGAPAAPNTATPVSPSPILSEVVALQAHGHVPAMGPGFTFSPPQFPTASAPAYGKGLVYFDTTLNKLRVGGATGWETVTSA